MVLIHRTLPFNEKNILRKDNTCFQINKINKLGEIVTHCAIKKVTVPDIGDVAKQVVAPYIR